MKKVLFVLLFIYSTSVFPLEIEGVKNLDLKKLYIYNGSRQSVAPEDGVVVYIKGKANKKVELKLKKNGVVYLAQGVRIENLRAKRPIILLDKYGEGKFEIGFSLIGEKKVSGKYKKKFRFEIKYIN